MSTLLSADTVQMPQVINDFHIRLLDQSKSGDKSLLPWQQRVLGTCETDIESFIDLKWILCSPEMSRPCSLFSNRFPPSCQNSEMKICLKHDTSFSDRLLFWTFPKPLLFFFLSFLCGKLDLDQAVCYRRSSLPNPSSSSHFSPPL